MYFVRYRPQAAIPALRCGISRSLFCQKKGHGVPAAWLGTKGTYPICLMLRRRSIIVASGVGNQPHGIVFRRGHEPRIAVGRIEHLFSGTS